MGNINESFFKLIHKMKENWLWPLDFMLRKFSPLIKEDKWYIQLHYLFCTHKRLHISNPKTYNEKLQWLKLNDFHPEYSDLVDKYKVKGYVEKMIGVEHVIPTLGVWNRFEEIDFTSLPQQFVLKTTHDSGGVYIIKDKHEMDLEQARKVIQRSLNHNYFYVHREYPYKNVAPRIIAEKYMVDESGTELKDYKIFCFDGVPKIIQVDYDRFSEHKRNLYDTEWNRLPFTLKFPTDWNREIAKPEGLQEMLDIASKLSLGIPHVRVDLYHINGKVYFGELTFFHGSGHEKFTPEEWNYKVGEWLNIKIN